jgi:uncharacterized membrane protein
MTLLGYLGLLFVVISIPLALGKIRRNKWYGFRIPPAFESEADWQRINRFGGKVLLVYGLCIVASDLLIPPLPAKYEMVLPMLLPASIWIPLVISLIQANRKSSE